MNNYSESVMLAIRIAQSLAEEYRQAEFTPAHLLRALMHPEVGMCPFIKALGRDYKYIIEWADVRIEDAVTQAVYAKSEEIKGNEFVGLVFDHADHVRMKLGLDLILPLCILTAIVRPGIAFTLEKLKSFPIKERDILELYLREADAEQTIHSTSSDETLLEGRLVALPKYTINRLELVKAGKVDPVIGRDKELRMMQEILCRRMKPNVIICGDAGVGKTALIDGFAQDIVANNVPAPLQGIELFELDLGLLVAGASYKGEIEDRLKQILNEIKRFDKAILFIDEIHSLLDSKGAIGNGAGNLLKPELARGEITVIGATTLEEYRKIIEPEQAFSRRFELLKILEPTEQATIKMLVKLSPHYEQHHGLIIEPDAIVTCVRFAKRYLKDSRLPDSAIDLLDRSMAAMRLSNDISGSVLDELVEALEQLKMMARDLSNEQSLIEYKWLHKRLLEKVSPVLLGQLEESAETEALETSAAYHYLLENMILSLRKLAARESSCVTGQDIAVIVAHKTGIPLGKIEAREQERLLNMQTYLAKRVVGQELALKAVSDAILESRSGLNKQGQPVGSFFLLGPTGTGKTELAKSIADFLFNDEKAIIRFDMSEFKEEHSAALLYGAPPGYVGYEAGGLLVNKIRQQPYSVILFDEIEKAHPSVFDIFLQILDEGQLHDRLGKTGDFSNALIFFTSNVGSAYITEKMTADGLPNTAELFELMSSYFRPEFLARLTEIVPFAPINEDNVLHIFDIQLNSLVEALKKQGIKLEISDDAKRMLALDGFTSKYGARQLSAVIRNRLRRPISNMLVTGKLKSGNTLLVGKIKAEERLDWKVIK